MSLFKKGGAPAPQTPQTAGGAGAKRTFRSGGYAALVGAFAVAIAVVGVICSLLGRMLGDISPLWGVPVGVLLVWLGLDLMGVAKCRARP